MHGTAMMLRHSTAAVYSDDVAYQSLQSDRICPRTRVARGSSHIPSNSVLALRAGEQLQILVLQTVFCVRRAHGIALSIVKAGTRCFLEKVISKAVSSDCLTHLCWFVLTSFEELQSSMDLRQCQS